MQIGNVNKAVGKDLIATLKTNIFFTPTTRLIFNRSLRNDFKRFYKYLFLQTIDM